MATHKERVTPPSQDADKDTIAENVTETTGDVYVDVQQGCTRCEEIKSYLIDLLMVSMYALYIGVLLGFLISKRIKG